MKNQYPPSLWVLCLTETWERYGFYAIQSLIALYLSTHIGLEDKAAYLLVGAFTALTYISPVVGGWIADHLLGQKKSVLLGAVILLMSYLGLAFNNSLEGIIYSLSSVAVGTGLLKPNISSLLGRQYQIGDPKRNMGFTIFYMGINLGILLGTTIPVQIQMFFHWQTCFISAACGLLLAAFIFIIGCRLFAIPEYSCLEHSKHKGFKFLFAALILIGFSLLSFLVLNYPTLSLIFFTGIVFLSVGYITRVIFKETGLQKINTISFFLLCIISVIFWSLYFEMFMALTFFITRTVQPTLLGFVFPAPYYVAVQSIGIIVFGFFLQKFWAKNKPTEKIAYRVSIKFSLAVFLMMLAYSMIIFAIGNPDSSELISPWLVLLAYLIISLAELMLSPIGLAAVTDLIRPQIVSTMMGIFFVTLGLGGYFSGKLANIAALDKSITDITVIKNTYYFAFIKLTGLLFFGFILSLIVIFIIRGLFVKHFSVRHAAESVA